MKLESVSGAGAKLSLNVSGNYTLDGARTLWDDSQYLATEYKIAITGSIPSAPNEGVFKHSEITTMHAEGSTILFLNGQETKVMLDEVEKFEYMYAFP